MSVPKDMIVYQQLVANTKEVLMYIDAEGYWEPPGKDRIRRIVEGYSMKKKQLYKTFDLDGILLQSAETLQSYFGEKIIDSVMVEELNGVGLNKSSCQGTTMLVTLGGSSSTLKMTRGFEVYEYVCRDGDVVVLKGDSTSWDYSFLPNNRDSRRVLMTIRSLSG